MMKSFIKNSTMKTTVLKTTYIMLVLHRAYINLSFNKKNHKFKTLNYNYIKLFYKQYNGENLNCS